MQDNQLSTKRSKCEQFTSNDIVSSINSLPDELLSLILHGFQRNYESFLVKLVCKRWNSLVSTLRLFSIKGILSYYAHEGNFEVLRWFKKKGYSLQNNKNMCHRAAEGGQLEVLKWLRKKGCVWDSKTCSWAAYEGHFELLIWAHNNDCPWDESTCSSAALGGHLQILKWLRENGCPWNSETCASALNTQHIEIFLWARESGCEISSTTRSKIKVKYPELQYLL